MDELSSADYRRLLRLLEDLSGRLDPTDLRQAALDGLAREFGYERGVFFLLRRADRAQTAAVTRQVSAAGLAAYVGYYHTLDLFLQPESLRRIARCGAALRDQLIEPGRFRRSEFYQDFLRAEDIEDLMGIFAETGLDHVGTLGLFRGRRERPFDRRDGQRLQAIVGHLSHNLRNALLYQRRQTPRLADSPLAALSEREWDVLVYAAEGLTNREIAERLGIAEPTVKKHCQRMFAKTGCANRAGLVALFLRGHAGVREPIGLAR